MNGSSQLHYLSNGYRHIALGDVNSTNVAALEFSRVGEAGKLWVTAKSQSKGKASRGRSWVSTPGNLYASLLLNLNVAPEKLATLSFVASLAVYDALAKIVLEENLSLKWPNDVLYNRQKISGILLENHVADRRQSAVIIGIGVNCNSSPDGSEFTATNISKITDPVNPELVFEYLNVEMAKWLAVWDNGLNFVTIRDKWLGRSIGLGQEIVARLTDRQVSGIFESLDNDGCLILKTSDGQRQTISVADIFFSNPDKKSA